MKGFNHILEMDPKSNCKLHTHVLVGCISKCINDIYIYIYIYMHVALHFQGVSYLHTYFKEIRIHNQL